MLLGSVLPLGLGSLSLDKIRVASCGEQEKMRGVKTVEEVLGIHDKFLDTSTSSPFLSFLSFPLSLAFAARVFASTLTARMDCKTQKLRCVA